MKVLGYAAQQAKAPLKQYSFERREPGDNDVVVALQLYQPLLNVIYT